MLDPDKPTLLRIPFAAVALISLVVLFTPVSGVSSAPAGTDKVVHLLLFGGLAATGLLAWSRVQPLLIGLVCYAAVSEVLQGVLPSGRDGDVLDAVVDVLGSVIGWSAMRLRRSTRRPL